MKVAIAGASGFVGKAVIEAARANPELQIRALSRRSMASSTPNFESMPTNFFSLLDAEAGLAGCDYGIYLLHSMSPSNRLSQGSFEDFDFILADNFARAARTNGLKHIVYVGGIIPPKKSSKLSKHLQSRWEVEKTLGSYGVPVTALRSSLVIGRHGSSFVILRKLVQRLPSMLLPAWVRTPCQPIAIDDLVQVILNVLGRKDCFHLVYDIGAPEKLTYRDLIEKVAEAAGLKRRLYDIPSIPLFLSKLWVRLVTGTSKSLVYPLIDSLDTPMLIDPAHKIPDDIIDTYLPIDQAISFALQADSQHRPRLSGRPTRQVKARREVSSVQRLSLPPAMDAYLVARAYFKWLPRFFTRVLFVRTDKNQARFYLTFVKKPLLVLTLSKDRSSRDRQLFYITDGLLAQHTERGRLEFRENPGGKTVFAAIHDFRPSLPWWVYRFTQAVAHRGVMIAFEHFLRRLQKKRSHRSSAPRTKQAISHP